MKAIILAAGVGRRLGKDGQIQPKCLLKFNGKSLLERHFNNLRHYQIDEIVIAVGYQAQRIQDEIKTLGAENWVSTVYNPDYTKGSVISLWTVGQHLAAGDDILLMDADVLCDRRIIERLVKTNIPNSFLLDRDFEPGDEPVKLCVRDNYLVEFRKQVALGLNYDLIGESVGFFRFGSAVAQRLATRTEKYVADGQNNEPYEEVIRDLLLETPEVFSYEDITGLPWVEIDFPQDIQRAQNEILPQIEVAENV
ncbi:MULTISPECIES: phosphocholine cytidylyltransferase family protein [unclassified Nostoc]|uniref:phosphocholine cytidylyltransferase family protein n=1 Tax=unclassified Nostoc TaxID=2593658 RepID=UPI002AD1E13E|nr:phosphocholine cytidylyltransferase family protein [Nostoc sp. DedQUE03]MDZ7973126.1 phosphocholine cytidylyltransferase family protein [Nostoc sp. DedQUE03]MDZ8044484.1 phosphocholine cytidylyltransferase family protein [Nostoc sp. DedQUE02]